MPVVKTVGNTSFQLQFTDLTTGDIISGSNVSTRHSCQITKNHNGGVFLDGTGGFDFSSGNVWFYAIMEV